MSHILTISTAFFWVYCAINPGCEPGFPAFTQKGSFPWPLFPVNLDAVWVACRALVNAFCRKVWLRNSLIWEFSATSWSNFVWRSLIWEDWALIFPSFLVWDLVTTPSSSDSVSADAAMTVLTDAFVTACWRVPRTLASLLQNCVKVIWGICFSRVFAIDALLWSLSWLAYLCFKVVSKSCQKSGFLLMTFPGKNLQFISESFFWFFWLLATPVEFCQ